MSSRSKKILSLCSNLATKNNNENQGSNVYDVDPDFVPTEHGNCSSESDKEPSGIHVTDEFPTVQISNNFQTVSPFGSSCLQAEQSNPGTTKSEEWSTVHLLEEPEFATPINNLTVPVGREAILSCTVNNLGKYKVAWVRAEDQTILSLHTKVVTHNSRIGVTHDNLSTWQLRIRQLKESDRGCYMCQINTAIMKIQKGCLDVYVPPDIINDDTSGDLSVSEGENATLWCKATGHPIPRIVWKREDGQSIVLRRGPREYTKVEMFNGTNLHFWRLDRRQMGAYLCIASNDVPPAVSKRIALNVNFAPMIKVPNQLLGAPLNTDVQLECYVEAFPNTINYWIKNRGEMLLNGTKYSIREDRSGYKVFMWLVIKSFSPNDIGTYNCVSTNSLGRAEGTLRLYEIKVGPGSPHEDTLSIVGGLAEPARGHRENSCTPTSISPVLFFMAFTIWVFER